MVWNIGCLDYSEFPNIRPRNMKSDYFAKVTQKCNVLGISLDKDVEKLDDHACPKFREFVDPKRDKENKICPSYPFRHETTLHCEERKAKMLPNWAVQPLKTKNCVVKRTASINVIESFKKSSTFFPRSIFQ